MTTPAETPEETQPKGDCPHCEIGIELDANGRIGTHDYPRPGRAVCPGSGKKPLPPVQKFIVRGNTDWEVEVEARTADEAGRLIDDTDYEYEWWKDQEILAYAVDEVVSKANQDNHAWDADERQMCQRKHCGHPVADHTGRYDFSETRDFKKAPRLPKACSGHSCDCLAPMVPDEDEDDE